MDLARLPSGGVQGKVAVRDHRRVCVGDGKPRVTTSVLMVFGVKVLLRHFCDVNNIRSFFCKPVLRHAQILGSSVFRATITGSLNLIVSMSATFSWIKLSDSSISQINAFCKKKECIKDIFGSFAYGFEPSQFLVNSFADSFPRGKFI